MTKNPDCGASKESNFKWFGWILLHNIVEKALNLASVHFLYKLEMGVRAPPG